VPLPPTAAALQALVLDMAGFNASYEGRSLWLTYFTNAFSIVRTRAAGWLLIEAEPHAGPCALIVSRDSCRHCC
jgi:hypothetical protein